MKLDSPSSWLHIQTLQGAPLAPSKRSVTRTVMSPPLPNGEPASAGSKSGCLAGKGSLRCAPSPRTARVGVSEKGTHLTRTRQQQTEGAGCCAYGKEKQGSDNDGQTIPASEGGVCR